MQGQWHAAWSLANVNRLFCSCCIPWAWEEDGSVDPINLSLEAEPTHQHYLLLDTFCKIMSDGLRPWLLWGIGSNEDHADSESGSYFKSDSEREPR
jgi:hypothetical protein